MGMKSEHKSHSMVAARHDTSPLMSPRDEWYVALEKSLFPKWISFPVFKRTYLL